MASIQNKADQLRFKGRGPLDAKSLVKTYAELLNTETWTIDGTLVAYNGMIVAVWLDKTDEANNGIYYFFDPAVTSPLALKNADVTNPANWHKISDTVDVSAIENTLSDHESRLTALEEKESDAVTYGSRSGFPAIGEANKLYVAADEGKSYVWFNDDYLPVGGSEYEEPAVIYGGSAD
jgi:hypothetical protein